VDTDLIITPLQAARVAVVNVAISNY